MDKNRKPDQAQEATASSGSAASNNIGGVTHQIVNSPITIHYVAQQIPAPMDLRVSQRYDSSPDQKYPYFRVVTIQSNVTLSALSFVIYCDAPIADDPNKITAALANQSSRIDIYRAVGSCDKWGAGTVAFVRLNDISPPLRPESPLNVALFSTVPFNVREFAVAQW